MCGGDRVARVALGIIVVHAVHVLASRVWLCAFVDRDRLCDIARIAGIGSIVGVGACVCY